MIDFSQLLSFHIEPHDFALVGILGFLEVLLSIDNALVLAMMARHLPPHLQRRALTYGLIGAIVFRLIAIGLASALMHSTWVKFAGGGYLVFLALKFFLESKNKEDLESKPKSEMGFWKTVVLIELMDIAFAVDSILAAVALSNKVWIIFAGGLIGVLSIRFAAKSFIGLLERFPGFESTAYVLILIIGLKVILDGLKLPGVDFHSPTATAFWVFWSIMGVAILSGFRRTDRPKAPKA